MHVWMDIDKKEDVPFFNSLINELRERGHSVIVTAPGFINTNTINSQKIGYLFSFFGLSLEPLYYIRAVFLMDYIKDRKFDIAFSLGSKSMLYSSIQTNLPIILYLQDYEKRPHNLYFALDKSFFIISDSIPDQHLIEKGYNIDKVARYKGTIDKNNPDPKIIKEISNQIEALSQRLGGSITA